MIAVDGRVFILSVILALTPSFAASAELPEVNRVLLLYSHEREMAMYAGFDRAFRTRLQNLAAVPIEFYTEYLDLMRFDEPLHQQNSIDYFQVKYARPRINLIVTIGELQRDIAESVCALAAELREAADAADVTRRCDTTTANVGRVSARHSEHWDDYTCLQLRNVPVPAPHAETSALRMDDGRRPRRH